MSKIIDLNNEENRIDFSNGVIKGAIFAYPTEAVFGLGCDIRNKESILKILDLKKRDISKGLIVISDNYEKVRNLIDDDYYKLFVNNNNESIPTTWLCPSSRIVLPEITGNSRKIAIRISKHKISCEICKLLNLPIISTSANIAGDDPIIKFEKIDNYFDNKIDYIVQGEIGGSNKPSRIIDLLTKKVLREGG